MRILYIIIIVVSCFILLTGAIVLTLTLRKRISPDIQHIDSNINKDINDIGDKKELTTDKLVFSKVKKTDVFELDLRAFINFFDTASLFLTLDSLNQWYENNILDSTNVYFGCTLKFDEELLSAIQNSFYSASYNPENKRMKIFVSNTEVSTQFTLCLLDISDSSSDIYPLQNVHLSGVNIGVPRNFEIFLTNRSQTVSKFLSMIVDENINCRMSKETKQTFDGLGTIRVLNNNRLCYYVDMENKQKIFTLLHQEFTAHERNLINSTIEFHQEEYQVSGGSVCTKVLKNNRRTFPIFIAVSDMQSLKECMTSFKSSRYEIKFVVVTLNAEGKFFEELGKFQEINKQHIYYLKNDQEKDIFKQMRGVIQHYLYTFYDNESRPDYFAVTNTRKCNYRDIESYVDVLNITGEYDVIGQTYNKTNSPIRFVFNGSQIQYTKIDRIFGVYRSRIGYDQTFPHENACQIMELVDDVPLDPFEF